MKWDKIFGKKVKEEILPEDLMIDEELDDEEFFTAEEIGGYGYCEGYNAARCTSDCFAAVMMPTISTLS